MKNDLPPPKRRHNESLEEGFPSFSRRRSNLPYMQRHIHRHTRRNVDQSRIIEPREPFRRHLPQHLRKPPHEAPRHVRDATGDVELETAHGDFGVRVRGVWEFGRRRGGEGFDGGVEGGEVGSWGQAGENHPKV